MRKFFSGFTLIEVLVIASIIALLTGAAVVNYTQGTAQSRDAERKSDLRNIEAALELYRLKNGRYPEGCNGPTNGNSGHGWDNNWSGQIGTNYECPGGSSQYIIGLAPEFISTLPTDPRREGVDSGYVYTVSEDGMVYKFMALNTVETETVERTNEFSRCGLVNSAAHECQIVPQNPSLRGSDTPVHCRADGGWDNDYAVKSGFASRGTWLGAPFDGYGGGDGPVALEYFSEIVRCK